MPVVQRDRRPHRDGVAVTPACQAGLVKVRTIDCDDCAMSGTSACDDCVVSFVLRREPGEALLIDAEEERALRALQGGGLVPELRHHPRRAG